MEKRNPALEARLKAQLKGCCFGGTLYAYDQCDSTMERAHALVREGIGEGALVFASRQERGRGRLGRKWESPDGGAYFSLILKPSRPPAETPQLSLIAGLATAEAIHEQLTAMEAGPGSQSTPVVSIRWPNDVLIDGKKVAGILTEASTARDPRSTNHEPRPYVVLGIGINVTTDPKDLPETATSLQAALTSSYPRSTIHDPLDPLALTAMVCRKLDGWYDVWTAQGFAPIRQALRPWMSHLGGLVRLKTGSSSQAEGQATDLDESGRLLVRLDSGITRAFDAGEVTL